MKGVFLDGGVFEEKDLDGIKAFFSDWTFHESTSPKNILEHSKDAEVLLVNKVKVSKEVIAQLPKLRFICVTATGVNNIDIEAAKGRNILVHNAGDYSTESVAQHTLAFILALSGRLVENREFLKNGDWQKSPQYCLTKAYPLDLAGKTLGIIGYGNIGKRVGELASCFGMKLLIAEGIEPAPDRVPLKDLLPQVDFLSLHCPLTDQTKYLISKKEFELMPNHSILINVSRGGLVHENDLANALTENKIFGAGVDVFEIEPPKEDDVLLNLNHPRLLITPHIAWGSKASQKNLLEAIQKGIKEYTRSKT